MLFNSKDTDYNFNTVKQIKLYYQDENGQEQTALIQDLQFHAEEYVTELGMITRCASAIAEFDEIKVKKIEFSFEEEDVFRISEIFVLGK